MKRPALSAVSAQALVAVASFALGASVVAWVPTARAADACLTAPVDGQRLQRAGKLLAARDRFATCARKTCPVEVVPDCTKWEQQVASAIPSVALAARDAKGADLVDVRVSIDGQPEVGISASAVELDPGPHRFVFRHAASADVEVDVVLREGEKDRPVGATFGVVAAPSPSRTPASSPRPDEPPSASSRPVPVAVWIAGGISVLGVASFATFGELGVNDRSSSGCNIGCSPSQKDHVDTELRVADISLGVAIVALGVATWLFLTRPTVADSQALGFDVRPAPGGGVATFGARF